MPRRNKQIKHIPMPQQTTCQAKRRFDTEQIALKAADDQMLMNISLSLHVYKCEQCTGWHLTRSDK